MNEESRPSPYPVELENEILPPTKENLAKENLRAGKILSSLKLFSPKEARFFKKLQEFLKAAPQSTDISFANFKGSDLKLDLIPEDVPNSFKPKFKQPRAKNLRHLQTLLVMVSGKKLLVEAVPPEDRNLDSLQKDNLAFVIAIQQFLPQYGTTKAGPQYVNSNAIIYVSRLGIEAAEQLGWISTQ